MSEDKKVCRVLMTGLCAFVPKLDIKQSPTENQMRVLLVESTASSDIAETDMAHAHEPHVPVLVVPCRNVDLSSGYRMPDLVYQYDDEWAVFYLDGQDLRVKGALDNNLEVVLESGAGCGCPKPADPDMGQSLDSFDWVPSFKDISPGSEDVDSACLEVDADPSVVARVELRQGRVFTVQLGSDPGGKIFLWQYKVPNTSRRGASHRQAAAQIVGFDTYFEGAIELVTKSFRPGLNLKADRIFGEQNERTIRLIPAGEEPEMSEEPKILVWVKNMPWADILQTRRAEGYRDRPDVHFAHLYKILTNYKDVNVPHFYDECHISRHPFHQGNPNCQPVRTAPNNKA